MTRTKNNKAEAAKPAKAWASLWFWDSYKDKLKCKSDSAIITIITIIIKEKKKGT